MKCSVKVSVTVKGKIEDVLKKVKSAAASKGVKFDGDEKSGKFSGDAEGTYTVDGQTINITITDKPFYASDSQVSDAIKKFFAGM
jgi:hypothetical protein